MSGFVLTAWSELGNKCPSPINAWSLTSSMQGNSLHVYWRKYGIKAGYRHKKNTRLCVFRCVDPYRATEGDPTWGSIIHHFSCIVYSMDFQIWICAK